MNLENDLSLNDSSPDETNLFEAVFKSHYRKLILFANRFTNDLNISEEIVADVFTVLWEKRKELSFRSEPGHYLFKMVQNSCLNYLKHQKIENLYINYLEKNNLLNEMLTSVEIGYEEKELTIQINNAINSLPEKCKQVFMLSRFNDLKYREIAQLLDISPKTVERHMSIALEKLRQNLKKLVYMLLF
jgi:RNA polymerase sigma-70 factor (family 1)